MLLNIAKQFAQTSSTCTVNGQPADCSQVSHILIPIILVFVAIWLGLFITLLVFWIRSLTHVLKHQDVPDRTLWIVLHFIGLGLLTGVVYLFVVKKPYDKSHTVTVAPHNPQTQDLPPAPSTTNDQQGFGTVEILIFLAAVVAIGLVGWGISRHKAKPVISSVSKSTTSQAQKSSSTNNATTGETKYLTISEWGIKFALTADTADAYYDSNTSSSIESRALRVHSLDSEADCTTGKSSVSSIFKVAKDAPDESNPGKTYQQTQEGKVIGDFYYFIASAQYYCTDNTDKQITLQAVHNSFNTASPTIQKL